MIRIKEINEGADYMQQLVYQAEIDKKSFNNLRNKQTAAQHSSLEPSFEGY